MEGVIYLLCWKNKKLVHQNKNKGGREGEGESKNWGGGPFFWPLLVSALPKPQDNVDSRSNYKL